MVAAATCLTAPHASADQLSDLRAKAQAIAAKIQAFGYQEASLGERFDAATLAQQQAAAKVSQAAKQVASANAKAESARSALRQEAVDAYTRGGASLGSTGHSSLASADNSLLRAEYVDSLATNQNDAMDSFHLASLQAQTAKAALGQAETEAGQQAAALNQDRQAAAASQRQLQGVYAQDQGQISQLVAQIQAEQAAAAAAAAQKAAADRATAARAQTQAQAQQAAATVRSSSSSSSSSGSPSSTSAPSSGSSSANNPAPPPGRGASGAVAAALSRQGDPYVWGASGPSSFDCSGLVAWAYGQVGISLPHYSGAQYSDGTHISMSQLQPGDLVFPSDPGQHVAIYVGNGEIVEAPYTGASVRVVPMYSFFVQAVRIA